MPDLLREAEGLAYGFTSRPEELEQRRAQVAFCLDRWKEARVAAPGHMAVAIAEAWEAEARVAHTAHAKACCLRAAKIWRGRAVR